MSANTESHAYQRFWVERSRPSMLPNTFEVLANAPAQLDACERLMLYTLVRSISPEVAVEVGTFHGGSATIIHAALTAAGRGHLWCIDPRPQLKIDWKTIEDRATLVQDYSPQAFKTVGELIPSPIEFAFIDGIHLYAPVIADTNAVVPLLARDAWILYHDALNHETSRGIDHCIATIPGLQDGGTVCRYFNNTQWPRTVMGGFRLLHFHDPNREGWLPSSYHQPASFVGASAFTDADRAQIRSALQELVAAKKTPIAVYGLGPHFAGMADILADFSDSISCILEDDPLFLGSERLGWPMRHPLEAAPDIRAAILTMTPGRQAENADELRRRGIEVVDFSSKLGERPLASLLSTTPDDPLTTLTRKLEQELSDGTRRIAFYGAGQFLRRLGIWLAQCPTNFLAIAVVDDDPKLIGKRLWGMPIIKLEDLHKQRLRSEIVVLVSPKNEAKLSAKRPSAEKQGARLVGTS